MTLEKINFTIEESGKMAEECINEPTDGKLAAAQWMQVKMLAEIARQLALMNESNGVKIA